MRNINEIADAVRRNERITCDDALVLWREAPLWLLGELATERKRRTSGESVYYNRNVHLEPTNICLFNCEFCSFRRREGDNDAWYLSLDEVEACAAEHKGTDITEVHIVGGVHPKHDLGTYCAMIRAVKRQLPHVTVKAYTAVEIFYMIRHEGISVVEGLRRLKEAGMECIPGGGAEIFDAELRAKICPEKCSAEEWLAVHRAAHNMDIATNCTMLYGHIESIEQRIDHLDRLRKLQDEAPGFDAFIPLKYHSRGNRLAEAGECSTEEDMRTIAISRIFLDNIPHIKAYWVSYGKATTEMALAFGADDIDGTIGDTTKIYSMAGGIERPTMSVAELEAMVTAAGFRPVERDSHYNAVERNTMVTATPIATVHSSEKTKIDTDMNNTKVGQPKVEIKAQAKDTPKPKSAPKSAPKSTKKTTVTKGSGFMERVKRFYGRFPVISHMILILVFGLLLLVTLYFGLNLGTRHGNVIKVPNLLGMNIEDARREARDMELNIIVRDSIFDVNLPGGTIVDQLPRTSSVRDVTVKPGRKIYVTTNAYNRRMVDVPYVAKQTLRQALNQLQRSSLTIDKLIYEADMTSTDYVLRESIDGEDITPTSSIKMAVGTGVTLTVSYRSDEQHTTVPLLVGLNLQQAKNSLWDSGLNVGKIVYDESVEDLISRRTTRVYKQSQPLGTSLRRGSEVTLYLSCDMELVDSLAKIANDEAKRYEEQRRKALEKQRREEREGSSATEE
ncbi:MAG: CofH family radical SAM protein [Alistipes sp.]|nr:CofH family radical SAM protein [Alistipes sp.]